MDRSEILEKVLYYFRKHNNILLEHPTGSGKTYSSLSCVKDFGGRWLIVLSESAHIKNWNDDIIKHNFHDLLMNIEFVLYASLHKYKDAIYDGIILDEGHHGVSDIRLGHLNTIKASKKIILSATIEQEHKSKLKANLGHFYTYKITLKQAIDWGLLPKPKIHIIELELDQFNKTEEIIMTKGDKKKRSAVICDFKDRFTYMKKYKDLELHVKCTQQEKYDNFCSQMDYWRNRYYRERVEVFKVKWLFNGTQRKRFLADCKTEYVKKLLNKLKNRRYICFTGSIKQCEELGGKNIVTSKRKNNQVTIDKLNDRKISNIFAVGMLKEGVNLLQVDVIVVQLDAGTRSIIQMIGRGLRHDAPEIWLFYYKNTQDETYLNNSLEEFKDYVV